MFGKDCVENCSMTCGDPGVCDKETGYCNGRCLPGWEGKMCQNGNNLYKFLSITLGNLLFNTYAFRFCFLILSLSLDVHVSTRFHKTRINA